MTVERVEERRVSVDGLSVIDFRARPNTPEFMRPFEALGPTAGWARYGYPRPPTVDVATYVDSVAAVGIDIAVFTGRRGSVLGGHNIANDFVAECARTPGGRIVGFAGIDPADGPGALDEMDRAVGLGLRGVALDPPGPYTGSEGPAYDDETFMYPVYEKAAALGLPVVVTVGPLVGRQGDPAPLDRVAADFPDLTLVCAHGVWPQVTELIALAYRRPNVLLETSLYIYLPGAEAIVDAANSILADQVVYASGFPFHPLDVVRRFMRLPFTDEAREKVLHRNAARVLGLDAAP